MRSYPVYGSVGFFPPLSRLVCCHLLPQRQNERLIRAGWGAVAVTHSVPFPQRAAVWGALYGPLPGELQGSDRAEVWAILQLLERTLGDLVIGTDGD